MGIMNNFKNLGTICSIKYNNLEDQYYINILSDINIKGKDEKIYNIFFKDDDNPIKLEQTYSFIIKRDVSAFIRKKLLITLEETAKTTENADYAIVTIETYEEK